MSFPIAEALRLIRTRAGLTQSAASKRPGAPDFRTISHWETHRKQPSLRLLNGYLQALGLGFGDLQEALDIVSGTTAAEIGARIAGKLEPRMTAFERRLSDLERRFSAHGIETSTDDDDDDEPGDESPET